MIGIRCIAGCALSFASAAHADVFKVGSGAGCTHATVQEAINAGLVNGNGLDVINVARNRTYTGLALIAQNDTLVIQGGYADCSSLTGDPANPTVLSGAGGSAAPVLRVQGNGNVTLRNLVLEGGDVASNGDGGGLSVIDGPHQITLDGVRLQNNHAGRGGGMAVAPSGQNSITVTFQGDSRISGNQASSDGGGIYCRNSVLSAVSELMLIASNVSARDGGGVYADNCALDVASGHAFGALWNNQSARNGGGLYLSGETGSTRIYSLSADTLTRLNANRADVGGGALYAANGAGVQIQNVEFLSNSAPDGGAILMRGTGSSSGNDLDVAASGLIAAAINCPAGRICNRYFDNRSALAGASSEGTAAIGFHLEGTSSGRAQIRNVSFESNQGGRIVHSAVQTDASGRFLELSNATFTGNRQIGTQGALVDGQKLRLIFASFAGNTLAGAALVRGFDYITILTYLAAWQPGQTLVQQTGGSISANFLIANDLTGVPINNNHLVGDPRFVSSSDLHLRPDSPALDFASSNGSLTAPYNIDAEGRPRPVDDSGIVNAFGPIDVGAFELGADTLFRNGFEN